MSLDTSQNMSAGENLELHWYHKIKELKQQCVLGTTSRRQIIVWKYNPSGCITALRNRLPIESISYSKYTGLWIYLCLLPIESTSYSKYTGLWIYLCLLPIESISYSEYTGLWIYLCLLPIEST